MQGYLCYNIPQKKFYLSRHVSFDETVFPFADESTVFLHLQNLSSPHIMNLYQFKLMFFVQIQQVPILWQTHQSLLQSVFLGIIRLNICEGSALVSTHPKLTRSKVGIVKPNPKYAPNTTTIDIVEPTSVKQALSHTGWVSAMQEELDALDKNDTWELVDRTSDMNVIGTKWVFKVKYIAGNTV